MNSFGFNVLNYFSCQISPMYKLMLFFSHSYYYHSSSPVITHMCAVPMKCSNRQIIWMASETVSLLMGTQQIVWDVGAYDEFAARGYYAFEFTEDEGFSFVSSFKMVFGVIVCVIPGITYVGTYRYKEPHENGEQNFIDIAFALVCPLVSLLQFLKAYESTRIETVLLWIWYGLYMPKV